VTLAVDAPVCPRLDAVVRGIRRSVTALLVGAALLGVGCTGGGRPAATSAQPSSPPATRSAAYGIRCLQDAERAAAFRFRVGEGLNTAGVILGQGQGGLVFGHQRGWNLCEWIRLARSYARLGYRALAFDFRDYSRLDHDVAAAVTQLRRRGVTRVVLVGSSMGGTAVLVAAARIRPPVAGVVSLSGPAEFGDMDASAAVARLRVPALFMAARGTARSPLRPAGCTGRRARATSAWWCFPPPPTAPACSTSAPRASRPARSCEGSSRPTWVADSRRRSLVE
jgi:pimeloyl-ACP methyl ester carboxylesterase